MLSPRTEDTVKPTPEQSTARFEHYEVVKGADGTPVELGRGAMGITYKAFDIDLHLEKSDCLRAYSWAGGSWTRWRAPSHS